MAKKNSTLEMQFNIFNDTTGEWFEVSPDRDGLDMIEIRYYDGSNPAPTYSLIFDDEKAQFLHIALGKLLEEKQNARSEMEEKE